MTIDDETVKGADVYLRWTMTATFAVLRSPKCSRTIGMGGAIERIRRRFNAEPS